MALQRVGWENGTLVEPAKVLADNTIQPAQYEGKTPLSAANLKKMEDNTENFVNEEIENLTTKTSITKLWENSSPNVSFSEQDITLSSDDYDYLIWFCIYYTGISEVRLVSYIALKGYGLYINASGDYTPNSSQYYVASFIREINRNSDTSFSVGNCYVRYGNSTNRPTQNVTLVPLAVYGGKF